jgi:hypothetical protein
VRVGRIDYRMQRRASLRDVRSGLRSAADVCDAHPDLVRAGVHIGSPVDEDCPVCDDRDHLRQVTYVFGRRDRRDRSGRAVPRASLARQLERHGDLTVYTVEVCTACHWHHLIESYQLVHDGTQVG